MNGNNNLTQQHLNDVQAVTSKMKPGVSYDLNLADDQQYNYLKNTYKLNGITEAKYPRTTQALEEQRNNDLKFNKGTGLTISKDVVQTGDTKFGTYAQVTGVGTAKNGSVAYASAYVSVEGDVEFVNATLQVFDTKDGYKLLASKSIKNQPANFVAIQASGGTPSNRMMAVLTYSYKVKGFNKTPDKTVLAKNRNGQFDPVVNEPVQKADHTSNPNIKIALSRGENANKGNNKDVDYWFYRGQWDNTTVTVPFVGSVKFANPIQTPLSDNLQLEMVVALNNGGACVVPANLDKVKEAFSIGADGRTLNWNLPANGATPGSDGNPIVYSAAPWNSDTVTYFFANIGVRTANNLDYDWAFVQSTDMADEMTEDGIRYIKPLVFLWHCLAEGTMITLADGALLPIEEVTNEYRVRANNNGQDLRVVATTQAPAIPGETLFLKVASGEELILSKDHVVITVDGPLKAVELERGMVLITERGNVELEFISEFDYQGTMYNLELEVQPGAETTMFANFVQVGDYHMEMNYKRNATSNPEYVKKHVISEEYHTDYMSSLEDNK